MQEDTNKAAPCWDGYTQRGMKPGANGAMVPNCVPVSKSEHGIMEGDYVMGMTSEGIAHGRVEHIMWEGGTLGTPGTEYAIQSMPPENPAMSIRVYEEDGDGWEATAYSIGMMYLDAQKLPSLENHSMPSNMEDDMLELMFKSETFSPNDGMKAAARRAIVNRMKDKAMFADFGKDFTRSTGMTDIFKAVGVGSMVSWNSSGGRAEGKITRIIRDGRYNVPGTEVTVTGTPEDPAAVIRLYRDGKPTDTIVAHKLKTLRSK